MSKNLKTFLGISYLILLIALLYFIFTSIEISKLNDFLYYKELQKDLSSFVSESIIENLIYFFIFAAKNFFKPNHKSTLLISFVMKKKIGNAVKRNKIRRKLKAIVQKLLKKRGAINKDYTYIVFGKSNAYALKQDVLLPLMEKSFSKLKK